jgi:hypothetical protein
MKHRLSLDRVEWETPMQTDDPESPIGQKTPWTLGDRLMAAKGPASLGFAPRPARAKAKLAFDELAANDERAFDPVEPSRDAIPPLAPHAAGDEPELSDILNRLAALSEPETADGAQTPLPAAAAIHPPVAASETAPTRRSKADRAIRMANVLLLALCIVLSLRLLYENAPADTRAGWMQRLSALQTTVTDMIARHDEALRGPPIGDVPPPATEIALPRHELAADAPAAPAMSAPMPPESSKATPTDTAAATDEPAGAAPVEPAAAAVSTAVAPTGDAAIVSSLAEARLPEPAAANAQVATPVAPAKPPTPVAVVVPAEAASAEAKPAEIIAAEVPISVAATAPAPNAASDKISTETTRVWPQVDAAEIAALMKRGDDLLGARDIAGARLFYERAGAAGSARGAISAGMTYDPVYLDRMDVRGIRPDPAKAVEWYGKALAQGETSALAMIARLR